MKYVLLGTLSADWAMKQEKRITTVKRKLKEMGMKLDALYYTQGPFDFVDVIDAPDAASMLAFSVWYSQQGFGKIMSLPAFDERQMVSALLKSGARGRRTKG